MKTTIYSAVLATLFFGLAVGSARAQVYYPQLSQSLMRGSRGTQVLELQKFISTYYNVPAATIETGYFGPITQSYVVKFQGEHRVPAIGIVGPLTRAAISTTVAAAPAPVITDRPTTPGTFVIPSAPVAPVTTAPASPSPTVTSQAVSAPTVYSISPTSGPMGTPVTITGSGFTDSNTVHLVGTNVTFKYDFYPVISANNGTTIQGHLTSCWPSNSEAPQASDDNSFGYSVNTCQGIAIPSGSYNISVSNTNGTSNAVTFVVTQ